MTDLDRVIAVARVLIGAAEVFKAAVDAAKKSVDAGVEQLKGSLVELEKMRDQLAADRADADAALDEKFR